MKIEVATEIDGIFLECIAEIDGGRMDWDLEYLEFTCTPEVSREEMEHLQDEMEPFVTEKYFNRKKR